MSLIVLKLKRCVRRQCATGHVWCYLSQSILKQEIYKCVLKQLRQIHRTWAMSLTCPCCFKIIWYAEIRNVLIKRCLNLVKKRLQLRTHNRQRQITDISTIDVNKGVLSDKVLCNNGKDCRHIVGYQVDGALIPLFIKTPKNIFSYDVSQYDKNSACQCHLMFLRQMEGCLSIKIFEMRLSRRCLKNW